jgi:hypothetical protein
VKERIINLDEKLQWVLPPIQDLLSLKVEDEAYLKLEPKQGNGETAQSVPASLLVGFQTNREQPSDEMWPCSIASGGGQDIKT